MAWNCVICGFIFLFFFVLFSYYRFRYVNDTSFIIRCNLNGCEKEYINVKFFVRYVLGIYVVFFNCRGLFEIGGESTFNVNVVLYVEDDLGMS